MIQKAHVSASLLNELRALAAADTDGHGAAFLLASEGRQFVVVTLESFDRFMPDAIERAGGHFPAIEWWLTKEAFEEERSDT